ncbi:MAG: hypothetical protein H0V07_07025, partial [Propionibacteriales bacterium]|nr:hypothetical protein [Propionibacteriales bacterium]
VVLLDLGRNDETFGYTAADLRTNLNSLAATVTAAGAATFFVGPHAVTAPWLSAIYDAADTAAAPLLDLFDRFTTAAPGLLSDGLHWNPAGQAAKAHAWVDLFDARPGKAAAGGGGGALDPDLTTIAGLTATTDNVIQSVASSWASRTPSQVKATMTPAASTLTAFGHQALNVATGANNTGFGYQAGKAFTTGANNTAVGYGAQQGATTGSSNVAVGYRTQFSMTTGSFNVGMGDDAQVLLTSGVGNVAIGRQAQNVLTTGEYNVGLGLQSQLNLTIGHFNMGIGLQAQQLLTGGSNNVAIGYQAQADTTTGSDNVGIGFRGGRGITTGTKNTSIGADAGYTDGVTASTGNTLNATTIGYRAQALASNVCVIGARTALDRVSLCLGNYGDQTGGGRGVFSLSDASVVPTTNPTGGGVLYAEAGALKWRGSAGTVSVIAAA